MPFTFMLCLVFLDARPVGGVAETSATPGPKGPAAKTAPEELIVRMSDPNASFNERCTAEDKLAKLPPQAVLPALLPRLARGMPSVGIYNSFGREKDGNAPIPWQIYYAIERAWGHQIEGLPRKDAGNLLLALLQGATKDKERIPLLQALANHWDAGAEPELAKLLVDVNASRNVQFYAAFPLILHGNKDYRDVMLQRAAKANRAEKERWFELLSDPRLKARKGVDARIVRLGFKLIEDDRAKTPDYVYGAYFLALKAGRYVGEEFAPSTNDPRYKSNKGGLSEQFFADTVQNALRWWGKNRQRFGKE